MRTAGVLAVAALVSLVAVGPARAEVAVVNVSMHDGLVSVNAKDATIRQILAEWARVGQTRIVNAEGIVGEPVTLQLTEVPEEKALEILLRSVSGYLAAPRAIALSNASRFDRILVMPTSTPSRATASPTQPPAFPQPRPQLPLADDQSDGDQPTRNGPPPAPPLSQQRGPVFNTFPPPINPQPLDGSAPPPVQLPAPTPTAAPGVSVPGMVVPTPPVPGQPAPAPPAAGSPQPR
jgi:hypothetical protein